MAALQSQTALYAPYKVVGHVCDAVPFALQQLGEEWFLTVSVGRSFQVFKVNKLYACLVSQQAPGDISTIQVHGHETYVSVGADIFVYKRARIVKKLTAHKCTVSRLLCIGKNLISLDDMNHLKVFDTTTWEVVSEMRLLREACASEIMHPVTYINKVLIGYNDGCLELWNINKQKLIYSFDKHLPIVKMRMGPAYASGSVDMETSGAGVSCIEQSPACDVVAVGFSSGHIVLLNLRFDHVLFSFKQDGGQVTSISFRTDAVTDQYPYMVSGSEDGQIHIWNLGNGENEEEGIEDTTSMVRKLQSSIEEAHVDAVSRVAFLHGEPVVVSAGASDNSIKVWIFDSPEGTTARLLRSRSGHRNNPTKIRYYGGVTNLSMRDNADATSCEIISVGADATVRVFNTAIESQNRELSQKPILSKLGKQRRNERLPVCIGFDYCETRQRDWGNLVTIHEGCPHAYVWKYKHRVATEMILHQPYSSANGMKHVLDEMKHASAVALSPCGNFCVVGCRGGILYKYNLQSGHQRGAFPKKESFQKKEVTLQRKKKTPGNVYHIMKEITSGSDHGSRTKDTVPNKIQQHGHSAEVTGVYISMMGTRMISCGLDGRVCFWDFLTHELIGVIEQPSRCPHLFLCAYRDADFVALAGKDRIIRMYDLQTEALARRFSDGHSRELTDMTFGSDGRRLLSAAMDCTLRVWDIPTGRCLSWLLFNSPVLSVAISHSGEYLCVAQADKEGIYMYIDRSMYETVHFWRDPTAPTPVEDSKVYSDKYDEQGQSDEAIELNGELEDDGNKNPNVAFDDASEEGAAKLVKCPRIEGNSIILSGLPRAYWTSLFFLEAIKQRNKPQQPPSKPTKAPFFLPSLVRQGGSTPSFPTPEEYAKLQGEITNQEPRSEDSRSKRKIDEVASGSDANDDGVIDMTDFEGLASAWDDSENVETVNKAPAESDNDEKLNKIPNVTREVSSSRIIRRETHFPRCKMEAYLRQDIDDRYGSSSSLLSYLKQLTPSAIDLEFRSLCTYEGDMEGVLLLQKFISWLKVEIESGREFELLQAYLHRFLTIYTEMIASLPQLREDVIALNCAHFDASSKFRHLLQKNLCLLKMSGNIPIT